MFGPKKLGLALGSGGARGLAHIGVLRILEAEGLTPDVVTGTSMGAIVGSFYAAGVTLGEMEHLAATTDIKSFVEWKETLLGSGEILSSRKLEALLREHLPAGFEELRVPFGCVATDLTHGRAVRFTSGDLATAVLASATIPSVFHHVCIGDMQLVDGSATEPVPVLFARELGAEMVVAVDVSGSGTMPLPDRNGSESAHPLREIGRALLEGATRPRGTTPLDVLITTQELLERQIAAPVLERASVVISPKVREVQGLAFTNIGDIVAAGEAAAAAAVPEIRRAARRRAHS